VPCPHARIKVGRRSRSRLAPRAGALGSAAQAVRLANQAWMEAGVACGMR